MDRYGRPYWLFARLSASSCSYSKQSTNQSRIKTVIVCGLTANLNRANIGGNVLLDESEANLPKRSVVNVSQVITVNKTELRDHIGTLSEKRVRQILDGIRLLTEPREIDDKDVV